jgi:hypothetical protein
MCAMPKTNPTRQDLLEAAAAASLRPVYGNTYETSMLATSTATTAGFLLVASMLTSPVGGAITAAAVALAQIAHLNLRRLAMLDVTYDMQIDCVRENWSAIRNEWIHFSQVANYLETAESPVPRTAHLSSCPDHILRAMRRKAWQAGVRVSLVGDTVMSTVNLYKRLRYG